MDATWHFRMRGNELRTLAKSVVTAGHVFPFRKKVSPLSGGEWVEEKGRGLK